MTPRTEEVLAALPSLRRYACALAGDQQSGDEYIRVTLETLWQEPWRLRAGDNVKFQLYKLFHQVLTAVPIFDSDASRGMAVLLLVTLERFSLTEAARLVQLPADDAASRLAHANAQLRDIWVIRAPGRPQEVEASRAA